MSERLTPERLAEVRSAAYDPAYPEDALESWDWAIRELLAHVDAQQAEIDRLTAALRSAREALTEYHNGCGVPNEACLARDVLAEIGAILAGTEAAAKAHDRRLRLEGAREFIRVWETELGTWTHADVLADMETSA